MTSRERREEGGHKILGSFADSCVGVVVAIDKYQLGLRLLTYLTVLLSL